MDGNIDILRRGADLARQRDRKQDTVHTDFLTPAEQYALEEAGFEGMLFFGGAEGCERRMAFFLPEWMEGSEPDMSEYMAAVKITVKFAKPDHRQILGTIMGQGVTRDGIGDIIIKDDTAWVFLTLQIADHIVLNLDHIGRSGAKCERVALSDVPKPEIKTVRRSFTVMSMRLDSVVSGAFRVSRGEAQRLIEAGLVTLNYSECLKADTRIDEADIISVRGRGKMSIAAVKGQSRSGRTFVDADIRA